MFKASHDRRIGHPALHHHGVDPQFLERRVIDQAGVDLFDAGILAISSPSCRSSTLVNRCLAPGCWTMIATF